MQKENTPSKLIDKLEYEIEQSNLNSKLKPVLENLLKDLQSNKIDLFSIRKSLFSGSPDMCLGFRPLLWKLVLGYIVDIL